MFLAGTSVLAGIYIRCKGLGHWPVSIDEYLIAKSVQNLLEHGVPSFPCGGYYTRGLLLQYLIAPFYLLLDNHELALRIVPVFFNILTIPPVFLLARRSHGLFTACLAVIIFSMSLWEIDIARYSRMYAPFQALFMWYLWCLYNYVVEGRLHFRRGCYVLSAVSVFLYEGAIFLAVLNFLPHVMGRIRIRTKDFLYSSLILLTAYVYIKTDFRHMGVTSHLPPDVSPGDAGPGGFYMPKFLLGTLVNEPVWLAGFLLLTAIGMYYLLKRFREDRPSLEAGIVLTGIFVLSLLNLFSAALFLAALSWFLGWFTNKPIPRPAIKTALASSLAFFIFWLAYALTTTGWHGLFEMGVDQPLRKAFVVLLKFPNFSDPLLYQYLSAAPFLLAILITLIPLALLRPAQGTGTGTRGIFFLFASLLIVYGIMGIIRTKYQQPLYSFFAYPILIILLSAGITNLARLLHNSITMQGILALALTAPVLALSEDFDLRTMLNIDQPEINFRSALNQDQKNLFVYREDYRSPAEYVNRNLGAGDSVITTIRAVEFYLRRLDFFYKEVTMAEFEAISGCQGRREIWTNKPLVHTERALFDQIDKSRGTVWIIAHSSHYPYQQMLERDLERRYASNIVYTGLDRTIIVYRLEKQWPTYAAPGRGATASATVP